MIEHLAGWLASPKTSSEGVQEFLARLAAHYGASGAGLVGPFPGPCSGQLSWWEKGQPPEGSFPWLEEGLADSLQAIPAAKVIRGTDRAWLLALLGETGDPRALIWVAVPPDRKFSAGEMGLLPLAGYGLWRALDRAPRPHPWALGVRNAKGKEKLEQSARLTGKLAHDFANLLTGVLGFAELTLNQLSPGSSPHQFLSEVCQSARQGATWVHKLQAFSRRSRPANVWCNLADAMAFQQQRVRSTWPGKAEFAAWLPPDLPPVALEAASLHTVLEQLLDNAQEALEKPGIITLKARALDLAEQDCLLLLGQPRPGRFVEVTVTDPGRGLPEALQAGKLDEAFIAHRRRQRGLGLAVAYGILVSHGGALSFSPAPEKGSIVRAFLPVWVPARSAVPPRPESARPETIRLVLDRFRP